jgi:hypothetical protein
MPATRGDQSWWICHFRINWPEGRAPDWAVDMLLAHAVVKPSLDRYADDLAYWRFHRRAVRDRTGHQLRFLFYTDPATARVVFASLAANPVLQQAKTRGLITRVIMDDPAKPRRPDIADTSDPHWSPTVQRHWPAYIMGVSLLWLGLIDDAVAAGPDDPRTAEDPLQVYRAAEKKITALWYKEGQHAFLHHLSAVFGYREMLIVKPMRF